MGKSKNRGKNAADEDSSKAISAHSNGNSNGSVVLRSATAAAVEKTSQDGAPPRSSLKRDVVPKPVKKHVKKKPAIGLSWAIGAICAVILAVGGYFIYLRVQERRVVTPFAGALIPFDRSYKNELLWGTYRPGVYFGVRSRTPDSVEMGMMWFSYNAHQLFLRHLCDQNDKLRYGWQQHDGRSFGYQEIIDDAVNISTTFVKRHNDQTNDWISRIAIGATASASNSKKNDTPKPTTGLFLYFDWRTRGSSNPFYSAESCRDHFPFCCLPKVSLLRRLFSLGVAAKSGAGLKLVGHTTQTPNLIVLELAVQPGFSLDVVYEPMRQETTRSNGLGSWKTPPLDTLIHAKKQAFRDKFHKVFQLIERGYNDEQNEFAQRVFSNLIGGLGYFYGESLVVSQWSSTPSKYWTTGLFTAVPSRSFFPRGFLWDEGFHQLLISRWDVGLTREVMTSWFNLMNADGWIPREQILGDEARSRVPDEFIIQNSEYANPPSFFLTIESMLDSLDPDRPDEVDKTLKFFEFAYPRLQAWYNWFNATQTGSLIGSYHWRGRNITTERELNPKTLTSGLDDYPRASHPGPEERHVDLYCWMAYGAGVLARVAEEIGENPLPYRTAELYMKQQERLDQLHWSDKHGFYADFGRHTDAVRLERQQAPRQLKPGQPAPQMPKVRVVDRDPKPGFVNALGYVSLFPLMLRLLDPSAATLGHTLDHLRSPNLLWTDYGVRSLARNSALFAAHNTEHDAPYWRGAVWINMNFLILKALKFYGEQPGPFQEKSQRIGQELRDNLVQNMYRQYQKTGYVWEQYVDGEGRGSHPFTGWSSLVVLIMSDF
ncbi:Mannosyl-oligosaccharide glucosidase GCS1 [Hypsibius exemplaris]|uniref:Mannosyl-oligosaccharide glucosidase n=1 Tax=Hypsibius exemplaris TaxID=2072580 RepID=A0A1W0WSB4_HYPEX|nr:Mannosyl-oligosaccharide glucosidase GCS1 [Hypsibius exemplaris]